jgi:large subunit ribosomal protein L23
MAIFKSKTNTDEAEVKAVAAPRAKKAATVAAESVMPTSAHMLLSPRVTEKATDLAARNIFVFNVKPSANKRQIIEAVRALYKVTPIAVRMVQVASKEVRHAKVGVVGSTGKAKKAYVQLKKGDTISLM